MIETKKQSSLLVKWSSEFPPVPARRWVTVEPGLRLSSDRGVEAKCQWPTGTLAWLRGAFQAGLTRNEGWQTPADPAARLAAHIFKRGVAWRPETVGPTALTGTYPVSTLNSVFRPSDFGKQALFLVDHRVASKWAHLGFPADRTLVLRTSEARKSLATIGDILQQAQAASSRLRGPTWYLVGGGILGDLGGFAASLAKVPFVQVPTTLLSMVDSSVGGKTGVNFAPYGKNQVGAFAFPREVAIFPAFLSTLPLRHLRGGAAECIKHGMLLEDGKLLTQTTSRLNSEDWQGLASSLLELVNIKVQIVDRDPMETGERATLNLGHTLAHALEAQSHSSVPSGRILEHGEAVGLGLAFSLMLSKETGLMPSRESEALLQSIFTANILPSVEELEHRIGQSLKARGLFPALYRHILNDKKRTSQGEAQTTQWVLLERRGKVHKIKPGSFLTPVDRKTIEKTWKIFVQVLKKT